MAQSKFMLYKYVKMGNGSWRYKKAAFYSNGKIKPNVVIVGKDAKGKPIEETHAGGKYVMNETASVGSHFSINADPSVESRTGVVLLPLKCKFFPAVMLQLSSG